MFPSDESGTITINELADWMRRHGKAMNADDLQKVRVIQHFGDLKSLFISVFEIWKSELLKLINLILNENSTKR